MAAPPQHAATDGQQAAKDLQRLLLDLGAEPELLERIRDDWTTLRGEPHVYVPPLPAYLVAHLVRLLPAGGGS